jgi:hypothetical protein
METTTNPEDTMTIMQDRLTLLDTLYLSAGSHASSDDGMSFMEAVSYVAGEPWSDHPSCVSPVIAAFLRGWNNSLPSAKRDRLLKPLIPVVVNTNTGEEDDETRAWMVVDWLVREQAPAWLRLAGLGEHADKLASLTELTGPEEALAAQPVLEECAIDLRAIKDSVGDLWGDAKTAAIADAFDAAYAASGAAAAGNAANAAWPAYTAWARAGQPWAAAKAAARIAVRDAATTDGWAQLVNPSVISAQAFAARLLRPDVRPVVTSLQSSAVQLVHRMCAVGV